MLIPILVGLGTPAAPPPPPPPVPIQASLTIGYPGPAGFVFAGKPRKKKIKWPGEEIEEEEVEEILAMLSDDL